MNTRQKVIVDFVRAEGKCSKIRLTKLLFLVSKKWPMAPKFYSFVPYKLGPYSFELFHDIERLESEKILETDAQNVYYTGEDGLTSPLDLIDKAIIQLSDKELIDYVYHQYPEFTIFSQIERRVDYKRDRSGILTIGYEGASIDDFLFTLVEEKVEILVDVRNNPWSMKYGFMKNTISSLCEKLGIVYTGMPDLGVPAPIRNQLKASGDYPRFFRQYGQMLPGMAKDIKRLSNLSKRKRIAVMCFEQDPSLCHRSALGEELARLGAEVEFR